MKVVSPYFTVISGKLGDAVGAKWRDVKYLRSWVRPSNPQTEKQMAQRTKFKMVSQWLKPIKGFLNAGWELASSHCTGMNAAMSYVMKNAVTGTHPNWSVNAADVLVSRGGLTKLQGPSVAVGTNGFTVTWTDNTERGDARSDDELMVLLYNLDKSEAECITSSNVKRNQGTYVYKTATDWSGDTVAVWVAVKRADGSAMSDSQYLGSFSAV